MSDTPAYSYTEIDVQSAFENISETLFKDKTSASGTVAPKMLIVAGIQGSGKTYLLENTLLPTGKYANYIRLYLPDYRKKHPQYAAMEEVGVLHAYEHTEKFVKAVCTKIFTKAFSDKYSIIMESALDLPEFASFPSTAVAKGYQFEVHVVACKKEFTHLSTITRGLKSLKDKRLERFVRASDLDASLANAKSVLDAFEESCSKVVGAEITLHERGFGELKDRRIICRSLCDGVGKLTPQSVIGHKGVTISAADNTVAIKRSPGQTTRACYTAYSKIVNTHLAARSDRKEMIKECHLALSDATQLRAEVPIIVHSDLYSYIVKHVFR